MMQLDPKALEACVDAAIAAYEAATPDTYRYSATALRLAASTAVQTYLSALPASDLVEWLEACAYTLETGGMVKPSAAAILLRDAATALRLRDEGWRPTHRHVKRGSTYQVLGPGELQSEEPLGDEEPLVIYRAKDGTLWARPVDEFNDGRFEPLPSPPSEDGE